MGRIAAKWKTKPYAVMRTTSLLMPVRQNKSLLVSRKGIIKEYLIATVEIVGIFGFLGTHITDTPQKLQYGN